MFGAHLVLHLMYDNMESANVANHRQNGYATAKIDSDVWFKSKESFMALVCKAFERLYDEMKNERQPDGKS